MQNSISRRELIQSGVAAAMAAILPVTSSSDQAAPPLIWGALLHMGTNMWSDLPVKSWAFEERNLKAIDQVADVIREKP